MTYKVLNFQQKGDDRGRLVVVESQLDIPFDIQRIFYIYDSENDVIRGQHANYNSQFVLINVSGTSKVRIHDGYTESIVVLDHPHMGVFLPKMVWKEMYDFSDDSILLVLSDHHYDSNEYIRDFQFFLKEVRGE